MTSEEIKTNRNELLDKINSSRGARFYTQIKSRSFSLNIFLMNTVALIEASLHVSDPDHGMTLMMEGNREAGTQAHREINRHLHNFTASAMTLVEHTRVFMNDGYARTEVYSAYEDLVLRTFKDDPLSQFVQKLRNYMVHKGLPNSEMFLDLKNDSTNGAQIQTGVRIGTASLLEWDGWSSKARRYVESAGDALDIRALAEEYLARVNRFHAALENELRRFHAHDLLELEHLQSLYRDQEFNDELARAAQEIDSASSRQDPPNLPSEAEMRLADLEDATGDKSRSIQEKIKEVTFRNHSTEFPSQRHAEFTVTDADIVGEPVFWGPDANGVPTISYITRDGTVFGLPEIDYQDVENLLDAVVSLAWASTMFSRKFVADEFLEWSRASFLGAQAMSFAQALLAAAEEKIKPVSVWLPVENFEIESEMGFGQVRFAPITEAMVADLETKARALAGDAPERSEGIAGLFRKIRKDFQGSAAVVIPMEAEANLAEDIALIIGRDAVDLLRFFSPGAPLLSMLCPTALAGAAFVPGSRVLFITDQGLSSMTSKLAAENVCRWRLRTIDIERLMDVGFSVAGNLVIPDGLNEFEKAVRASVITYSKGTTFSDPLDRLAHAIAAVEGVLLKHGMEPTEFNVADRMSYMLAPPTKERAEIKQNVRQAYRLRTRLRAVPLAPNEMAALQTYVFSAHSLLATVLLNVEKFQSRADFVDAVDELGMQSSTPHVPA